MKKRFFRTVVADTLFCVGLAAIVVGIAMAGHLPAAICTAGAEGTGLGVLLQMSGRRDDH